MTREPIFARLFGLVSAIPALKTKSRKLLHWSDVPANQRPALFQAQGNQTLVQGQNGLARWTLTAKLYVYVSTQGAASPGEVLNPIIDAIEALFRLDPARGQQTLGGLVQWARIEGTIETSEGTLGNDEVAQIPILMLVGG